MPQALPVIGAVASVVGTVGSLVMQSKSARLQEENIKTQEKQQDLAVRQSRRQAYRQMQVARARSIASAQGAGVLQSSGVSGGVGALTSQLGSQLGYQTAYGSMSRDISQNTVGIQRAQNAANLFSGIASVGGRLFNAGGGFGGLFGGQGQQQVVPQGIPNYAPSFSVAPTRPTQAQSQTPYFLQSPYGL